jgi:amidophosphoribosyltransferase
MCGIFGIVGHQEAANITYLGLHALQHRGQEGAGIVSTDGQVHYSHRKRGLVGDVFTPEQLVTLKGNAAIGHNRYSTTGNNRTANIQPFSVKSGIGWMSVAHNGNLTNADILTEELEKEGSIFQSTTDTEVIIHLMAKSKKDLPDALVDALMKVQGSYSLLVLNTKLLIAVRDPLGIRPLVLGEYQDCPVFASETSSFDLIGAKYVREVDPGEMIVVNLKDNSMESVRPFPPCHRKRCVFEFIYFARPDSTVFGASVFEVRKALGKKLAQEQPCPNADVVIPVPDSGNGAAIGYSQESKIPYDMGLIRSHYVGRTFIEPTQSLRNFGVRLKLNAVASSVKNKSVVVVDDSLVRGTTSRKIIKMLRDAGAREVHLRISAPPTTDPCFYGIDTPNKKELIAAYSTVEEICDFIEADSIGYLSPHGLNSVAVKFASEGFCNACFTGNYPVQISLENLNRA